MLINAHSWLCSVIHEREKEKRKILFLGMTSSTDPYYTWKRLSGSRQTLNGIRPVQPLFIYPDRLSS